MGTRSGRNWRGSPRRLKLVIAATGGALLTAGAMASTASAVTTSLQGGPITINDNTTATPYPSSIQVSGLQGNVMSVRVSLDGYTHMFEDDTDVGLQGPEGAIILMSDVGGNNAANDVHLELEDGAPPLPDTAQFGSGTFRPTNFLLNGPDTFPPPAPPFQDPGGATTGATFASVFAGTTPNGTWNLFARDDAINGTGSFAGWRLHLTTPDVSPPNPPETTITQAPKDKTRKRKATFGFTASAVPVRQNATFQCKLDDGPFEPCTSPTTYRVKKGKHTFQVEATVDGVTDSTPATDTWKRKKPKKK
jgi:subtilisin-like proprotein convertase family protein